MVLVGGPSRRGAQTVLLYDPAARAWEKLPDAPFDLRFDRSSSAPAARQGHTADPGVRAGEGREHGLPGSRPTRRVHRRRRSLHACCAGCHQCSGAQCTDSGSAPIMIAAGLFSYAPGLISGLSMGLAPLEDFAYPVAAVLLLPALWLLLGERGRNRPRERRRQP